MSYLLLITEQEEFEDKFVEIYTSLFKYATIEELSFSLAMWQQIFP